MNERITQLEEQFEKFQIVGGSGVNVAGNLGVGYVVDLRLKSIEEEAVGPPLPINGACCVDEICSFGTEEDCIGLGGTYQGDHTFCSPNPCLPPGLEGACCTGIECSTTTESDCLAGGGVYLGDGMICPDACAIGCCNFAIPYCSGGGCYSSNVTYNCDGTISWGGTLPFGTFSDYFSCTLSSCLEGAVGSVSCTYSCTAAICTGEIRDAVSGDLIYNTCGDGGPPFGYSNVEQVSGICL